MANREEMETQLVLSYQDVSQKSYRAFDVA